MSKLDTTIKEIQAKMRGLAGIRQAPNYPDDKIGQWPAVVCLPVSGVHRGNTLDDVRALHDILIQFHYPRKNLAEAVEKSVYFAESIPNELFSMIVDGDFTYAVTFTEITYRFVGSDWANEETCGFEFTINGLKIRTNVT